MPKTTLRIPAILALSAAMAMPALADTAYVTKLKAQQVASLTFPVPYAPNEDAYTRVAFVWDEFDEPYVAELKAQQIAGLTFPVPYMPRYAPSSAFGQFDAAPELGVQPTRLASR